MTLEEKAEAIRQMQLTPGWRIIEDYLSGRVAHSRDQLMTCQAMEDVIRHRATIRAHESVRHKIDAILNHDEGE